MKSTKPKIRKEKEIRFSLIVKGAYTGAQAERAILRAFASRQPDGMEFFLSRPQMVNTETKTITENANV